MTEEIQTIRPDGGPREADRTKEFIQNVRIIAARGRVLGAQGRWLSADGDADLLTKAPVIGLAVAALGPVTEVYAAGDDYVQLTLVHDGGARTQLALSNAVRTFSPIQGLDVYSTAGTVSWSGAEAGQAGEVGDITAHGADADLLQRVLDAASQALQTGQPVTL